MEGHHLIPMEYQDRIPHQTLDAQANIISLCPTCHRRVQALEEFVGIDIELIESYYGED